MVTRTPLSVTLNACCLSYLIYKNMVLNDSLPSPAEHNDSVLALDSFATVHISVALLSPLGISLRLFSAVTLSIQRCMLCALCPLVLHTTPRDHADSHNVQLPITQFSATDRSKYWAASRSTKHMLLPVTPSMCRGTRTC